MSLQEFYKNLSQPQWVLWNTFKCLLLLLKCCQLPLVVKEPTCHAGGLRDPIFLGQEDSLKEGMATHSSILAWRIPWTEKSGTLQSIGLQGVRHNWSNSACMRVMFLTRVGQIVFMGVNEYFTKHTWILRKCCSATTFYQGVPFLFIKFRRKI